jgi:hypothetical protein
MYWTLQNLQNLQKIVKTSSKYCTMVQYLAPLRYVYDTIAVVPAHYYNDIQSYRCLQDTPVDVGRTLCTQGDKQRCNINEGLAVKVYPVAQRPLLSVV